MQEHFLWNYLIVAKTNSVHTPLPALSPLRKEDWKKPIQFLVYLAMKHHYYISQLASLRIRYMKVLMNEFSNQDFLKNINERRVITIADYYIRKGMKQEAKVLALDFLKVHSESDLIKKLLKDLE